MKSIEKWPLVLKSFNTLKEDTITSYEHIPFGDLPKKFDDKPDDSTPEGMVAEAARKREHRLIKNREAARECRRKKKEYIKVSSVQFGLLCSFSVSKIESKCLKPRTSS